MDERELQRQLAALLAEELVDRVATLNQLALELERDPEGDRAALHRVIHAIKGASRSAGVPEIEAACHRLESETAGPPSARTIRAIFELADALDDARPLLAAAEPIDRERFAAIAAEGEPELRADTPAPEPGPADGSVRIAAADLDRLLGHTTAALQARQRLAGPVAALGQLRQEVASESPATIEHRLRRIHRDLIAAVGSLARASVPLDADVRRLRLRSLAEACHSCSRIARDAAEATGKHVDFELRGEAIRIDRTQIEGLREVLVQLVRNAVAHGIESPEDRQAAGKPQRGTITVDGEMRGDAIAITVRDDGRGLDLATLEGIARRRGFAASTPAELARAIFAPGVSTAATITELAGRGVGLDVARQRIEAMRGSIEVAFTPGAGTTFTLELPTTVATIRSVVATVGGTAYAIPNASIDRVLRVASAEIRTADGRDLVAIGPAWLPVASLQAIVGGDAVPLGRHAPALVLVHGGRRVVVLVDQIVDELEVLIESLGPRVGRLRHVASATTLADGEIALILNVADVVDDVLQTTLARLRGEAAPAAARRILLVDDSATTRALELNILRAAGYEVLSAVDGADALAQLEATTVDLIVTDIDMPELDGFGLTEAVRASARLAAIPIILVTARGNETDRARGMRVGANAYLVKSSFDQDLLLETIGRLL